MRFLMNYPDPQSRNFILNIFVPSENETNPWVFEQRMRAWLSTMVIAAPQATKIYSVAALQRMGLVGIYEPD